MDRLQGETQRLPLQGRQHPVAKMKRATSVGSLSGRAAIFDEAIPPAQFGAAERLFLVAEHLGDIARLTGGEHAAQRDGHRQRADG